tara:strand:+ start:139 stop:402 length:264 start_codon:yes stop_codon:yes gene_type:complete
MPNISKKTAYDVKEASNQLLSPLARNNYAKNAQAGEESDSPMSMKNSEVKVEKQMSMMGPSMYGSPAKMNNSPMQMKGSWMSKHCSK